MNVMPVVPGLICPLCGYQYESTTGNFGRPVVLVRHYRSNLVSDGRIPKCVNDIDDKEYVYENGQLLEWTGQESSA